MKKALLLIDLQNDFMPGGALAVPQGNEVIAIANRLQPSFDWVIATQDWHPANHGSFAANNPPQNIGDVINLDGLPQIMWPIHCVQNTNGANFTSDLDITHIKAVFQKGTDPNIDSYSGFFDNGKRKSTGLGNFLLQQGITDVYIMGLALDYWVNLQPTDGTKALAEMEAAGVKIVQNAELYVK